MGNAQKQKTRQKNGEGKGIEVIPEEEFNEGQEYDLKSEENRMLGCKREQKLRGKNIKNA